MTKRSPGRRLRSQLGGAVRRYRGLRLRSEHARPRASASAEVDLARAAALNRIDVSVQNAGSTAPTFAHVASQVVSAAQFVDPSFERLCRIMFPDAVTIPWGHSHATVAVPHRKLWEFVYVMKAAEQHAKLESGGGRALGFGVGQEPIPAALARHGLSVLATDLDARDAQSAGWAATGQHMSGLEALCRPEVVSDEVLRRHVQTRQVDMNAVPDDLGRFDLIWSACALEHLGSPKAGLEFVLSTLELLEPGGVAVHTTELELTPRAETADYGHLAVYRVADLDLLAERVLGKGFEISTNWYVSLDTPADRWISLPPHPQTDPAHLKLMIGDSVSTSVGLLIRRPSSGG